MSYLGNEPPQLAGYSVQTKAAPVGSSITLDQEGSVNSVLLFLEGVRQTPTTDYTISGSTLTLTSTAPTTAVATVLHLGDVVDIGTPGSSTVNVSELSTDSAGSTGQFLKKSGASAIDWATVDALPSQTSQSGKFLTTDGSDASWATAGGANTPSFGAYRATDSTYTDDTWTIIPMDTEEWDTDTAFDHSTYTFTVPADKAGKYFFSMTTTLTNSAAGEEVGKIRLGIYKGASGGSSSIFKQEWFDGAGAKHLHRGMTLTGVLDLIVGDFVQFYAYVETLHTPTLLGGQSMTFCSGFKLL